ncbi:hypothetical protein RCL_jg1050.t1 [Rhizophagus clarus]|uniref:Uncharacterized protein n=1 Tax=Rhizophagus clarus TaxID=94130 RepID=A0A8H3R225_9GLOM|nr:hypothetical protein RCL_jg1050.t1 [Rhizophagus clarus]
MKRRKRAVVGHNNTSIDSFLVFIKERLSFYSKTVELKIIVIDYSHGEFVYLSFKTKIFFLVYKALSQIYKNANYATNNIEARFYNYSQISTYTKSSPFKILFQNL